MTPKEKAKDILEKLENCILDLMENENAELRKKCIKQCARVTVDEIIEASKLTYNPSLFDDKRTWYYWMDVKAAIESL